MKTGYLFKAFNSKGVSHHHLLLAETLMQAGEEGKFYDEKEKASSGVRDWQLAWGSWNQAN